MTRVVLITGASGGLGLQVADAMLGSAKDRQLVFHYHNRPEPLRSLVRAHGKDDETSCFQADLRREAEVGKLREKIEAVHGSVDSVVCLHGATSNALSWKMRVEDFQHVVDANLLSTFLVCREFTPAMRKQGRGRLVNVSSVVAFTGVAGAAHYAAAKAGVVGLTKSLASELASKGITANAVALGYFDAGMIETVPKDLQEGIRARIPMGRFGAARELVDLLEYLLGDSGGYLTGQVLHLNGGLYG